MRAAGPIRDAALTKPTMALRPRKEAAEAPLEVAETALAPKTLAEKETMLHALAAELGYVRMATPRQLDS